MLLFDYYLHSFAITLHDVDALLRLVKAIALQVVVFSLVVGNGVEALDGCSAVAYADAKHLGCELLVSHEVLAIVKNKILRSKSFSRSSYLLFAILTYQLAEIASRVVSVGVVYFAIVFVVFYGTDKFVATNIDPCLLESQNVFVTIFKGIGPFEVATCLLEILTYDVGTKLPNS